MEEQRPRNDRIRRIDPIAPTDSALSRSESAWVSVIKAFNPIGAAAEAYAKTLAYRIEVRRLKLEAERVQEQAKVLHSVIDKTYELKMEQLRHRRIALERTFSLAEQHLGNLYLERRELNAMMRRAQERALQAQEIPIEERALYVEMVKELNRQILESGQTMNRSVESLIQALPHVELPRNLLESGD